MKAIIKAHPETKKVVSVQESANGNQYGRIRVDQACAVTENGFLSFKNRSAFIVIGEKDLDNAIALLKDGMEYPAPGKIVRTETREPQYEGHKSKINPETGDEFLLDGQAVYFTDKWESDLSLEDTLLSGTTASVDAEEEVSQDAGNEA